MDVRNVQEARDTRREPGYVEIAARFNFDLAAFFSRPVSNTYDRQDKSWIYAFACGDYCKVGIARDVDKRLKQLRDANPYNVDLLTRRSLDSFIYAAIAEKAAHQMLSPYSHRNEWFLVDKETAKLAVIGAHKATVGLYKRRPRQFAEYVDFGSGMEPAREFTDQCLRQGFKPPSYEVWSGKEVPHA